MWNIVVNDAGAEYDPLTLLRTRTMYGRPDWNSIYTNIRNAIETGQYLPGSKSQLRTRVGTYFCGVCSDTYLHGCSSLMLPLIAQRSGQGDSRCVRRGDFRDRQIRFRKGTLLDKRYKDSRTLRATIYSRTHNTLEWGFFHAVTPASSHSVSFIFSFLSSPPLIYNGLCDDH